MLPAVGLHYTDIVKQKSGKEAVKAYLEQMRELRDSGWATPERSYYDALNELFRELGGMLSPKVLCVGEPKTKGSGSPDFQLYTAQQHKLRSGSDENRVPPDRGVVEVKGLSADVHQTIEGEQVKGYLQGYGLVLVCNYREFLLVERDSGGAVWVREEFCLAGTEAEFWELAGTPGKTARASGSQLAEFLLRSMSANAPITTAEDVAWILGSYARQALAQMETVDMSALNNLKKQLETALGFDFGDDDGTGFFRSVLVQTLFYGVFSAWLTHVRSGKSEPFEWTRSPLIMKVPMIKSVFEEVGKGSNVELLGVTEILDNTAQALNRVDPQVFPDTADTGEVIQHFYEPFLKHYDPKLQKKMGVWYTPKEIVAYMVERTDRLLREELGIEDGLADSSVQVLDPCCGTGAYLVEVLKKIHATLTKKFGDDLVPKEVAKAAATRIFGFEIMPAPYVIAHWRIGDYLRSIGGSIDYDNGERAAVYLTNALTGWQKQSDSKPNQDGQEVQLDLFEEFATEKSSTDEIKQDREILVILGNPPYNAFAGKTPESEAGQIDPYKKDLSAKWDVNKSNLNDLYIRFWAAAENRINLTGKGIAAFITNHSWVQHRSFPAMRKSLLTSFDKIWIDDLHGNRRISELGDDGDPSETIFRVAGFSQGIQQGVAITLAVKVEEADAKDGHEAKVSYRDNLNASSAQVRREQLVGSLNDKDFEANYVTAEPFPRNRFLFRPVDNHPSYFSWPAVPDLSKLVPLNGLEESRSGGLIDMDREDLASRMEQYFDHQVTWKELQASGHQLTRSKSGYKPQQTRKAAVESLEENFDEAKIIDFLAGPLDQRYAYYTDFKHIWNRPRPKLCAQFKHGNRFIATRNFNESPEKAHQHCSPLLQQIGMH